MLLIACLCCSCANPLVRASAYDMKALSQQFETSPNDAYYGIQWALQRRGYPIGYEDLKGGTIATTWVPTRATSHYVQPFGGRDYGTTGAYHQLVIQVLPSGGVTTVTIQSRVKSLAVNIRSSEEEERAIFQGIADALRRGEINVTNVGVE